MDLIEKVTPKDAAVVVLHELSSDSLVLTQRSHTLRNHPGEICFPGGRWQVGDKNLYDTALRELQEELGIAPERIALQMELRPERTLSGYLIHPWLATIENLSPYHADKNEVAEVYYLPMGEIIKASNYQKIQVSRFGFTFTTYRFVASRHYVWGATARIMMQLIT
ncbi:NUDIX hydrolase [Legionella micdadei]|uniref:NUDIX domain-containing protein n=1 Tax=Legionella micdadei TaxID=451 RepID=A0A098GFM3_LEGMI|nr:CoA pyrophosphatase [Legionella micdadei]ARG97639.1 coenzyme A pyrophosphatase [Legionella micdadei]ARH00047.1 coenzyme A pyrophosphatase [Legionella micdadei]KTD27727.1 MutT/nudix family transporter protein [Legionella micdadei]CEG60787.1 NUDIX family hydrolase [Legionella micdadei]SCY13211.1 NUDIX domain-containing protein [Legionella micdadei]